MCSVILCIVLIEILFGKSGAENVALGKTTYQTDTPDHGYSWKAVDGKLSQNYDDLQCTHTQSVDASWWVDLGEVYVLTSITIYNRLDCCSERLRNVEIYIGYEQHNYKSLVAFHSGVVGSSVTFTLNPPIFGRWVEVTRNPPFEQLTLCEVQIEGNRSPIGTRYKFSKYTDRLPTGEPILSIPNIASAMQCVIMCWDKLCTFAFYDDDTLECKIYQSLQYSQQTGLLGSLYVSPLVVYYI